MQSLVIGLGEVGRALAQVLTGKYPFIYTYDKGNSKFELPPKVDIIHICFPYNKSFVKDVQTYAKKVKHKFLVIHSSVPVGTTEKIDGAFHSPIRGKHPELKEGILSYVKYVGYPLSKHTEVIYICDYFEHAGITCKPIVETKNTELMKLLGLCRYGTYIAFAKEQEEICKYFGCEYETVVTAYERTRNEAVEEDLKQPVLYPFKTYVGGHCTVEDMEILLAQKEFPLLKEVCKIDKGTVIWGNSNVYSTAKIGKGCSIGQFCEIGHNVVIGDNVRVGAFSFIPEGVVIEDDVFIAPKVTFSNDKYPPAGKNEWGAILVKKSAVIGMGSIILPNVIIGEKAVVGAGSIVTKDVPDGEVVYGQAAYSHGTREKIYG